ncbi:carbonic anhydrase 9 [Microcaecilia unicolor]|uniref:Carbonic anhydrase n=1 Tax=Microcaecilia unicolor TaxID=1415580 RepID=A0A6P7XEK3_9AMPH|nr:carbonic anhydrase 9 [Microcaecilia unicolor]
MENSACSCLLAGILLLLVVVTLGGSEDTHKEHSHPPHKGPGHGHWNYSDQIAWASDFHDCGGESQSPINIQLSETVYDPSLGPFVLTGFDVPEDEKLKLKNNGHTVVLDLPDTLLINGGLPQEYRAAQLHFHWGSHANPGSEHTVDGQRYSGEIHVVHYSTEFSNIREAMTKPGGLAVLAAFIQAGSEENPTYQHLLQYLPQVSKEGQDMEVPGFNIGGLLPGQMDRYYRYNGSLTTPPCFQSVNWTIFNDTIKLSEQQISILEDTLLGDDDEILQLNFRDAQNMHGRVILANFRTSPVSGRRGPAADPGFPPVSSVPGDSSVGTSDKTPEEDSEHHLESSAPGDSSTEKLGKGPEEDPELPPESPAPGDSSIETEDEGPKEDSELHPDSPGPGNSSVETSDKGPEEDADSESRAGVSSQPRNIEPDSGVTEKQHASTLGTGDMLAIIFAVLFALTALSFFIYVRKHRNRSRRFNTENKPNVIYKAATTEENIA